MASGTGPLSPDFSGVDPELMQGFVTTLEPGRAVTGDQPWPWPLISQRPPIRSRKNPSL
ncbi:hypothetical protein ACWEU6_22985 [Streptosporangium sandarakinum]|uniref:hypothetical protein n=1 Tax=Streptosporangium sandarakinum TaxID=1260955 RepID=UPI0036AA08AE